MWLKLRAFLFVIGLFLVTVFLGCISVFWLPLSYQKRYAFAGLWARAVLTWLWLSCGIRHCVEGLENLPSGPAVFLSKHQSAWETIAFTTILPAHSWVLKRELLKIPIFGWVLKRYKPIAIDREQPRKALRQLLEQGARYLQEGLLVVVFPEGTRVAPGTRRRYALGGAMLAKDNAVPIVPVAHNAGDFWPPRSFLKYPGTIRVCIGAQIETGGKSAAELNAAAEIWIEQTTAALRANAERHPDCT